jgi:hypothetical protein
MERAIEMCDERHKIDQKILAALAEGSSMQEAVGRFRS